MVGWHHRFNVHELGQIPGDGEGQGGLVCCSPWHCKESDMTWWLNNNKWKLPLASTDSVIYVHFHLNKTSQDQTSFTEFKR